MATSRLPPDFVEFLKLLNAHNVEYLVVGGHAVAYHGFPRATADLDVWIAMHPANAERVVTVLRSFGFDLPAVHAALFTKPDQVVRLGDPPIRIEVMTTIDGVSFDACLSNRVMTVIAGVAVPFIGLTDLKANKRASGRHKDLEDLAQLP